MFTKIITKELYNNLTFVQNCIIDLDGTFSYIIVCFSYIDFKSNICYYFLLLSVIIFFFNNLIHTIIYFHN